MANELEYVLRINAAAFDRPLREALSSVKQLDSGTRRLGSTVDGVRTSMVSAGGSSESLFDKIGRLGANFSNTVNAVKSANEAFNWMKQRGNAAAAANTAVATSSAVAAVSARSSGVAATAAGAGFGIMAGGALGAAGAVAAVTAVALPLAAALAAVTAGLAAASLAYQGAVRGVTLAANLERDLIAFKTLTGSMEAAKGVLEELMGLAAETPFQLPELTNAARKLLAAKVPIAALKAEMRALGNVSAATGADIGALATVYGQVAGKGKLYAEELQQFVEQGAGALRGALAESLGVSTAQLMDMMQKGEVGFSALQKAIQSLAGETGQWGESMREQSQTTWGLLSTVKDNVDAIFRAFGQPLNDGPVKAALQELVSLSENAAILVNQAIAEGEISETLKDVFIIGLDMAIDVAVEKAKQIAGIIADGLAKAADLVDMALNPGKAAGRALAGGGVSISVPDIDIDTEADEARKRMQERLARGKERSSTPTAPPAPADWAEQLDSTEVAPKSASGGDSAAKMKTSIDLLKQETAIMLARAQGQTALADALQAELEIRKEAQQIMQSTGLTEIQALAIAQQRWAAQKGIADAAKADAESKKQAAEAEAAAAKATQQGNALEQLNAELAILHAKATGQNELADALQRELSIRNEAARIAQSTGMTEERALAIARQKAALEEKAAGAAKGAAKTKDSRYDETRRRLSDGRKKIMGYSESRQHPERTGFGGLNMNYALQMAKGMGVRVGTPMTRDLFQSPTAPGIVPPGVASKREAARAAEEAAQRVTQPRWDLVESIDRRLSGLGLR